MNNVHGFSYFKDMAKFWSVLLEHFIKHQPLVSAECCLCTTTKFWCCHKEGVDGCIWLWLCIISNENRTIFEFIMMNQLQNRCSTWMCYLWKNKIILHCWSILCSILEKCSFSTLVESSQKDNKRHFFDILFNNLGNSRKNSLPFEILGAYPIQDLEMSWKIRTFS